MEKRGFRSAVKPLLSVFLLALLSHQIYYGSRRIGSLSWFVTQSVR